MKSALILAGICAVASQSLAFQSGAGSIEGQVVNLATGAPVRHATVNMNFNSQLPFRPGQPPAQYAPNTVETDDQGGFAFRNLAPGSYRVSVQKQGFAGGNNFQNQQGAPLYLGEQQQLKGVVVKLAPQSVIAGKVLDRNGDPLEHAQVAILRWQYGQFGEQWMPANSVQTNDLGEYRIAGIAAGRYRLSASYRDYRMTSGFGQPLPDKPEMSYVTTYFGDTADLAKAQFVTLSTGAEAHADIRMQMVATVRIRGRVIDPDASTPNRMATVSVVPRGGAQPGFGITVGVNGSGGDFELSGVPPGDYYLVARSNGPRPGGGSVMSAVQPVTVGDKPIDGIVLTLAPGRDVTGTVRIEGDSEPSLGSLTIQANSLDGLYNGMGPQVRGVSGSQFTLKGVAPGRTSIVVNNLPPNYFVKSIQYEGQEVTQGGADLTTGGSLVILLSDKGARLSGRVVDAAGKVVLRPSVALFSAGNQPSRFYQNSGDNNSEFRFFMLPPGEYQIIAWESKDGVYQQAGEFARLFGSTRATAVKLEAGGDAVVDVTAIPAAEVDAASGAATLAVEFVRTKGSVQGQVLRAKTGEPIKNALVRLNAGMNGAIFSTDSPNGSAAPRRASGLTAQTDDQGNFTFRDVDPGPYRLGAEHQGFVNGLFGRHPDMNSGALIVGEGQDVSKVVVRLAPQAVVAGKVTDEYGDPAIDVPVAVYSRAPRASGAGNSRPATTVRTNSLGEFRIAGLAAGTYILAVRPTGPLTPAELAALPLPDQPEMRYPVTYYPASLDPAGAKPIVLESGVPVTGVDVKLRKTASFQIRGRLTGLTAPLAPTPQGAARRLPVVSLYPVRTLDGMTLPAGSVSSRPDGSFTIAGVLPGTYLLTARSAAVDQSPLFAGALPVEVTDKNLDGIQLALKRASDVKASVSWQKATTVGLNGLFINLQSVYPTGSAASGQIQMDGETAITFHNVLAMPYKVTNVSLPWNCFCFLKSLHYGGRDIPESGADFTTGLPFEIVLSSSAAIVEGTVVDRQGKPVGGAALALAPNDSSTAKIRTGFADESGKFFFDNNPPGEYRLLAWEDVDPAALNDADFLKQFDASATAVKLEALGRQTVRPVAIPAK